MTDCMTDYGAITDQRTYDRQEMLDAMEVMAFLNAMPHYISISHHAKMTGDTFIVSSSRQGIRGWSASTLLEAVRYFWRENPEEVATWTQLTNSS